MADPPEIDVVVLGAVRGLLVAPSVVPAVETGVEEEEAEAG